MGRRRHPSRSSREGPSGSRSSRHRPTSLLPRAPTSTRPPLASSRQRSVHRARWPTPSTARTRPPGAMTSALAGGTCRARAVFADENPDRAREGDDPHLQLLQQDHGGWNSDDNQSCNLGRFRLSVTITTHAVGRGRPTCCQAVRVARSWRSPDRARRLKRPQVAAIFSHWRTTVPRPGQAEPNARIEELWKQHPEGSTQLVLEGREDPRGTSILQRGDFLKPVKPVTPGVPAFLNPLPSSRCSANATLVRSLAGRSRIADHGTLDREPDLANLFRDRAREHE